MKKIEITVPNSKLGRKVKRKGTIAKVAGISACVFSSAAIACSAASLIIDAKIDKDKKSLVKIIGNIKLNILTRTTILKMVLRNFITLTKSML